MRQRTVALLRVMDSENIPFRLFEGSRSPERQAKLFKKRPRVSKAKPWRSYHQYGCSADFVLFMNGRWSWSTKGIHKDWWNQLHLAGRELGLLPLSWEKPHLQLADVSLSDLRKGIYPADGDDPWAWRLNQAIDRWESKGQRGAPPYAEYDDDVSRPATKTGLEWSL